MKTHILGAVIVCGNNLCFYAPVKIDCFSDGQTSLDERFPGVDSQFSKKEYLALASSRFSS